MFSSIFETISNLNWYGKAAVIAGALGTVVFVGYLADPSKKEDNSTQKDREETKLRVLEFKISKLSKELDQLEDSINQFTNSLQNSKTKPVDAKQQAAFFSESLLQLQIEVDGINLDGENMQEIREKRKKLTNRIHISFSLLDEIH